MNLGYQVSSTKMITEKTVLLYREIVNPSLLIRRVIISTGRLIPENEAVIRTEWGQLDFFTDYDKLEREQDERREALEKERRLQKAVLQLHKKYGKNAVVKGMDLLDGAMTIERNGQVGGHKA